jgi:DNA-binding helix-turn-helix protein
MEKNQKSILATKLAQAIKNKGYTQTQLAELLHVKQTTISRWVSGEREPNYKMFLLLCAYLEESPNELLDYDEKNARAEAADALLEAIFKSKTFAARREEAVSQWKKEGKTEQEIDAGVEKMLREEYAVFCKKYRLNL